MSEETKEIAPVETIVPAETPAEIPVKTKKEVIPALAGDFKTVIASLAHNPDGRKCKFCAHKLRDKAEEIFENTGNARNLPLSIRQ